MAGAIRTLSCMRQTSMSLKNIQTSNYLQPYWKSSPVLILKRFQETKSDHRKKHLTVRSMDEKKFSELTIGEKVVRTGKDAGYGFVVVAGIGVTGVMFYMIGRELLSSNSPSGVYSKAFKLLKRNDQIYDTFGEPLKGYGEMNRRGRRRYVSHVDWLDDHGRKHMRMKFYIEGPSAKGTVHLEVKENEASKFEYRYLFVEIDNSYRTIILEDNR